MKHLKRQIGFSFSKAFFRPSSFVFSQQIHGCVCHGFSHSIAVRAHDEMKRCAFNFWRKMMWNRTDAHTLCVTFRMQSIQSGVFALKAFVMENSSVRRTFCAMLRNVIGIALFGTISSPLSRGNSKPNQRHKVNSVEKIVVFFVSKKKKNTEKQTKAALGQIAVMEEENYNEIIVKRQPILHSPFHSTNAYRSNGCKLTDCTP